MLDGRAEHREPVLESAGRELGGAVPLWTLAVGRAALRGGRERSGNFLIDNRRLVEEFAVQYAPFRQRVLQIINEVRRDEGLPLIK